METDEKNNSYNITIQQADNEEDHVEMKDISNTQHLAKHMH